MTVEDFISVYYLNNKPFPYQVEGVKALTGKTRFLLADDPGLGKTIQLIIAVSFLAHMSTKRLNVLVLCPKSMRLTWEREIKKWEVGESNWTIANWDKLVGLKNECYVNKKWDVILADESHQAIRNEKAKRCQVFTKKVLKPGGIVWLATATPASKGADDYYVTLKTLLPTLFVKNKWTLAKFKHAFCRKLEDPYSWSGFKYEGFNEEMLPVLSKLVAACSLRRTKEEVLKDLPEVLFTKRFIQADLSLFSPSEIEDIKNLRHMESYQERMQNNAISKIPDLVEIVETYPAGTKLVIFAWHKIVIEEALNELKRTGRSCAKITGDTPERTRQELVDVFQKGNLEILLLNMQSGGVGLTLTAASTAIYLEYPYTPDKWIQSWQRIHRIGSKRNVEIIQLMTKGSIDEEIWSTLTERAKHIEAVGV